MSVEKFQWLTASDEANTVQLVQSDTWVFRHPVTSNKKLWSQSIYFN